MRDMCRTRKRPPRSVMSGRLRVAALWLSIPSPPPTLFHYTKLMPWTEHYLKCAKVYWYHLHNWPSLASAGVLDFFQHAFVFVMCEFIWFVMYDFIWVRFVARGSLKMLENCSLNVRKKRPKISVQNFQILAKIVFYVAY